VHKVEERVGVINSVAKASIPEEMTLKQKPGRCGGVRLVDVWGNRYSRQREKLEQRL
jgi:hypothetical protein